eukprot:TRINITY_DN1247_c0_g2_i2.p1 TRINITY_DN1247_c0_g2~~TRINITY_DN1247_c0_g2_i2.p1  ORF type:complete len:706 (+),score=249.20 TRINITY_DN1247_c0_g2_i2:53-2170(+)
MMQGELEDEATHGDTRRSPRLSGSQGGNLKLKFKVMQRRDDSSPDREPIQQNIQTRPLSDSQDGSQNKLTIKIKLNKDGGNNNSQQQPYQKGSSNLREDVVEEQLSEDEMKKNKKSTRSSVPEKKKPQSKKSKSKPVQQTHPPAQQQQPISQYTQRINRSAQSPPNPSSSTRQQQQQPPQQQQSPQGVSNKRTKKAAPQTVRRSSEIKKETKIPKEKEYVTRERMSKSQKATLRKRNMSGISTPPLSPSENIEGEMEVESDVMNEPEIKYEAEPEPEPEPEIEHTIIHETVEETRGRPKRASNRKKKNLKRQLTTHNSSSNNDMEESDDKDSYAYTGNLWKSIADFLQPFNKADIDFCTVDKEDYLPYLEVPSLGVNYKEQWNQQDNNESDNYYTSSTTTVSTRQAHRNAAARIKSYEPQYAEQDPMEVEAAEPEVQPAVFFEDTLMQNVRCGDITNRLLSALIQDQTLPNGFSPGLGLSPSMMSNQNINLNNNALGAGAVPGVSGGGGSSSALSSSSSGILPFPFALVTSKDEADLSRYVNSMQEIEDRIRRELRILGILDPSTISYNNTSTNNNNTNNTNNNNNNVNVNYHTSNNSSNNPQHQQQQQQPQPPPPPPPKQNLMEDDEICEEMKQLQSELQELLAINNKRKSRYLQLIMKKIEETKREEKEKKELAKEENHCINQLKNLKKRKRSNSQSISNQEV